MSAFPLFDRPPYKPEVADIDGVTHIIVDDPDRDFTDDELVLEPHDTRTDMCVALPIRSVVSSGFGPAIEIAPFTLDSKDVAALYNLLGRHIARFNSEFRLVEGGAQ